ESDRVAAGPPAPVSRHGLASYRRSNGSDSASAGGKVPQPVLDRHVGPVSSPCTGRGKRYVAVVRRPAPIPAGRRERVSKPGKAAPGAADPAPRHGPGKGGWVQLVADGGGTAACGESEAGGPGNRQPTGTAFFHIVS